MKKIVLLAVALLLALSCFACSKSMPSASVQAVSTSAPTPEPRGMEKAFGKEIVISCCAQEDGLFAEGAKAQAERLGIPVSFAGLNEPEKWRDALIVYDGGEGMPGDIDIPAVIYTDEAEADAETENVYFIKYQKSIETEAALEAMYNYPSHEAPIRILGLFASNESEAYEAYNKMGSDGKLQSKGVFCGSDGYTAEDWLVESLGGITIGVLDTVYAETPELAMQGFAALNKAARNDAVEICAAGITKEQIKAMQSDHFLMGAAVGVDEYGAGMLAVRMAASALAGEKIEKQTELLPICIYSDDVIKLKNEGLVEAGEVLESLDTKAMELYNGEFMQELSEYYKA